MSIRRFFHDAWFVLTRRFRNTMPDEEYMQWLEHQERASKDSQREHQRRNNELERLMMHRRLPKHDGGR